MEKSLQPNKYVPTMSRAGNGTQAVFRGRNGFLRGRVPDTYFEVYGGSLDLGETTPCEAITGTIDFDTSSNLITGSGTKFYTELHLGQALETTDGVILNVAEIVSDTVFMAHSLPSGNGLNTIAYRLPVMFEVNRNRGTLLSGNAYEADTGNILAVGSGSLRINGVLLASNLIASKRAKIAVLDGATQTYSIYTLGFNSPPVGITLGSATAATAKTFAPADVNTTTNRITVTAHGYFTGQAASFEPEPGMSLPAPLLPNTAYYLIRYDANTLLVANLLQDAVSGGAINLTTAGTGASTTITPISKAMPAGTRGLRFAKASTKLSVDAFGNPGENVLVITTDGQRIAVSFPAMDSDTDPNSLHDAWRIYGTLGEDSGGVWYFIRTVSAAELGSTQAATYYLEYLDGEASFQLITFDNDPPPDAEYIASVTGYPVLVSCQGKATPEKPLGTSPGVSIVPFKVNNLAAAPLVRDSGARAEVPTSPPETIIGCYLAAGRLYLLTANSLPIAVFTADNDFPIATRPFWKSGFKNPYAICFVQGRLYGFTTAGALRSVADGEEGSEEHSFAADVEEITRNWDASRVQVAHDPKNEAVCFAYGGAYLKNGWYGSIILPFMLRSESWGMPIYIESPSKDMIISGLATVGGNLEFLAGGRDGGGFNSNAYRFDGGLNSGESISWQIAWSYTDDGAEVRPKTVKYPRVTGRTQGATLGIHGAFAGEAVDVVALESGNASSKSGAIAIANSTTVEVKERLQVKVSQLSVYTIAVEGIWNGGEKARLDEVSFAVNVSGARK